MNYAKILPLSLFLFSFFSFSFTPGAFAASPELYAGGQAVGVILRAFDPVVEADPAIPTFGGLQPSPAAPLGLTPGSTILAVDGRRHPSTGAVNALIQRDGRAGTPVNLLWRNGCLLRTGAIRPVFDPRVGGYRIGLALRRTFSGLGTLTFYDPANGIFASVGHPVGPSAPAHLAGGCPSAGAAPPAGRLGHLDAATIVALTPSTPGRPGSKIGQVLPAPPAGCIVYDGPYGPGGILARFPDHPYLRRLLQIASPLQVHPGPATVLTVTAGRRVRSFRILITAVRPDSASPIALRVTDPALLRAGGGLVAGMSGSPIIQDGRLAGAVTRILVADPARGYGAFAWNMAVGVGLIPTHAGSIQPAIPRSNNSRAWSRALAPVSPANIRAISKARSSPCKSLTPATVRPSSVPFSKRK